MNANQPTNRTRTGKIARLPEAIRTELNQRLRDGQPGSQILPWLNELPEVQQILHDLFADQPISHRNLTSWRQGGFRDDTQQHTQTQRLKELSTFTIELGQDTHNPSPVGRRCSAALTSQPHSASVGPTSHPAGSQCSAAPTSPNPTHFIQGALTLVTAQIFELLQTTDTPDLNQLITLIKTLTRLRSTEIARQNADLRRAQIQLHDNSQRLTRQSATENDPSVNIPQPTPSTPPQPHISTAGRASVPRRPHISQPQPTYPHLNSPPQIETLLRLFTAIEPNLRKSVHITSAGT